MLIIGGVDQEGVDHGSCWRTRGPIKGSQQAKAHTMDDVVVYYPGKCLDERMGSHLCGKKIDSINGDAGN